MSEKPSQRVSAIPAPERYELPSRPAGAPATAVDAFRQTQFLLGADLELFARAMQLQIALVQEAHPSRYRTHELAALIGLWSRVFLYLSDGMLLATRASYASTLPLVRCACEAIAAQEGLRAGEMQEHHNWLAASLRPDERFKAFDFNLGYYYAGSVIASDPVLRSIFRPVSDLARPNFGATLLQVGPESNNQRLALSFGDTSFHLGWAELTTGWLLALAVRQVETVVAAESIFPVSAESRDAAAKLKHETERALSRPDRCRIEAVTDGERHYLVHNFRRAASAAPRKVLL